MTVEKGASIWYGALLRADICSIVVRVYGAVLGERALLGNGSTMLDGSRLGAGSMAAAGSLVTPETQIPDGVLAAGAPAQVKKPIEKTGAQLWVEMNPP